jgi:hypothetical protein
LNWSWMQCFECVHNIPPWLSQGTQKSLELSKDFKKVKSTDFWWWKSGVLLQTLFWEIVGVFMRMCVAKNWISSYPVAHSPSWPPLFWKLEMSYSLGHKGWLEVPLYYTSHQAMNTGGTLLSSPGWLLWIGPQEPGLKREVQLWNSEGEKSLEKPDMLHVQ